MIVGTTSDLDILEVIQNVHVYTYVYVRRLIRRVARVTLKLTR